MLQRINMIEHSFTIGPRNCGKSEYIERQMSPFPQKLYIGTLWNGHLFRNTITEHQNRRDSTWDLYEITGSWSIDLKQIDKKFTGINTPDACLVDGLTTWAENIAGYQKDKIYMAAHCVVDSINYLFTRHKNTKWYFIDVTYDILEFENRFLEADACKIIYNRMIETIRPMAVLKWRI